MLMLGNVRVSGITTWKRDAGWCRMNKGSIAKKGWRSESLLYVGSGRGDTEMLILLKCSVQNVCKVKSDRTVFILEKMNWNETLNLKDAPLYSLNPNECWWLFMHGVSALKSLTMQVLNNMAAFIALPSILQRILQVSFWGEKHNKQTFTKLCHSVMGKSWTYSWCGSSFCQVIWWSDSKYSSKHSVGESHKLGSVTWRAWQCQEMWEHTDLCEDNWGNFCKPKEILSRRL